MSINILPGTPEALAKMKGGKFVPHQGEGVVYLKLVFLKPETIEDGDPAAIVEDAPGVIMCGQLSQIRKQIADWFSQSMKEYKDGEQKEPSEEKW